MSMEADVQHSTKRGGFTLLELLINLVVAVVLVTAVYQLLIGQNRLYMKQRELQDVRSTLRAVGNLLAFEFRQAMAANGDLYAIAPDSFVIRSVQGAGIVCAVHPTEPVVGLWRTSGEFAATPDDSALVFAAGGSGTGDDEWLALDIEAVWQSGGGGVPYCAWGGGNSVATELVARVDSGDASLAGVRVGAPFRAFRRVQYGIYSENGRWWLGRKVGSATSYEMLTGPLRPPTASGPAFIYYDQAGDTITTGDPTRVRLVDIVMRGESLGKLRVAGGQPAAQEDTLTIRVSLRG